MLKLTDASVSSTLTFTILIIFVNIVKNPNALYSVPLTYPLLIEYANHFDGYTVQPFVMFIENAKDRKPSTLTKFSFMSKSEQLTRESAKWEKDVSGAWHKLSK